MKDYKARYFLLSLCFAFGGLMTNAQDATLSAAAGDRYVISARAGGVNFVEGAVTVARKNGTNGLLLRGDSLDVGDRVTTDANGKAEILLNPGSFLRLGGNAAFEFKTTSLDNLELKLDRGSAILEVYAADEFKVSVATPSMIYSLTKTGVYRIDIPDSSGSSLKVWKGAAKVGTEHDVEPGRAITTAGPNSISVAKFDRDKKDVLDVWSKARSKELAKVSARLRREDLRGPLTQGFLGRRWGFQNSFGLWIFNPLFGGYCFLPFGYGWSSPYGFGYGNGMAWWWDMPWNFPMNMPTSSGGGTSTGGGSTPTGPAATALRTDRSPIPPFIRMEQMGAGGGVRGGFGNDRGGNSSDSGPSYNPSSPSSSSSSSSPPPSSPSSTSAKDPTGSKP